MLEFFLWALAFIAIAMVLLNFHKIVALIIFFWAFHQLARVLRKEDVENGVEVKSWKEYKRQAWLEIMSDFKKCQKS